MSNQGIRLTAQMFNQMQVLRGQLLRLGSSAPDTAVGQQDLRLGQLLEEAKEHIKDRFCEECIKSEGLKSYPKTRRSRKHG